MHTSIGTYSLTASRRQTLLYLLCTRWGTPCPTHIHRSRGTGILNDTMNRLRGKTVDALIYNRGVQLAALHIIRDQAAANVALSKELNLQALVKR